MVDGGESAARVQSVMSVLHSLDDKIDNSYGDLVNKYLCHLSDTEIGEKESLRSNFTKTEKGRISNLLVTLSKKIKDTSMVATSAPVFSDRKEQTYLKKTEPPKWEGDPVYFADFMRKWKAQVTPANLPLESELDRLRENIPPQASKTLFGEKSMANAW